MQPPQTTDTLAWQRHFAMTANNRAWQLAALTERSEREQREMLDAAHAAAWHWQTIGTEQNHMRAAMLLAEVHALLGLAASARALAEQVHGYFTSRVTDDWEIALVHAIRAHAAAVSGDRAAHAASYAAAEAAVAAIADPEDRRIVDETFRQVPAPGPARGAMS